VVAWTHEYGPKKTRVFSTTLGHNNATVSDPRYLELVTRAVLWSTHHLTDDGKPAAGYGAGGK
jgi:type 1 glutamine amidotransferase